MYNEKIEALIKAALADGVLTEKEKQILFKRAQEEGIDLDEFEMVLDARLVELQKEEKEKAAKSAPKSNKFGDVRKCPTCGALVPALAVSCPDCGYEFSGVEASSSSQILSRKIAEIKDTASSRKHEILTQNQYSTKREKGECYSPQEEALRQIDKDAKSQIDALVSSFPVPNVKGDLFDLVMYLRNEPNKEVYIKKYEECVQRASYLFPNDPLFAQIQDLAKSDKDERKSDQVALGVYGFFCILSLILWIVCGKTYDWGFWGWFLYLYAFICGGCLLGLSFVPIVKKVYLAINKKR